jgi:hypothetical protein
MNAQQLTDKIKSALAFEGHSEGRRWMEVRGLCSIALQEMRADDAIRALRHCKAAVENKELSPSARMELVRDYATPVLVKA